MAGWLGDGIVEWLSGSVVWWFGGLGGSAIAPFGPSGFELSSR